MLNERLGETLPVVTLRLKLLNGDSFKINVVDGEMYRKGANMLVEGKYTWHLCENKQTRSCQKTHYSYEPNSVDYDLKK